jgi:adenine-specific DNA-methyltransferase
VFFAGRLAMPLVRHGFQGTPRSLFRASATGLWRQARNEERIVARIHDLLERVGDASLRAALRGEFEHVSKHKKFGLVFEEHLPECTPLWGIKIKRGMTVARKDGDFNDVLMVQRIKDGVATCWHASVNKSEDVAIEDLIPIARFGDPIYPVLTPIDTVENAPGDKLWHTLIQADNYHALQLLEYLYKGKVDCIYIDPPYNTGARDWKYNNDYVDSNDAYRHSKWLSMMQKRLRIAKKLLNPRGSVLIVTIDEKEYLHLGMLLEEMFPEARIQMISSVINPSGSKRLNSFSRNDEYLFVVMIGNASPCGIKTLASSRRIDVTWETFRRHDLQSKRGTSKGGTSQFYPIYVNTTTAKIEKIGDPVSPDIDIRTIPEQPGCVTVWPIRDNGIEMNWGAVPETARRLVSKGYLKVGEAKLNAPQKFVIKYLTSGTVADIDSGVAIVDGYSDDGSVIAHYDDGQDVMAKTNWNEKTHNANAYGSKILKEMCGNRFSFPKSLYAVHDAIRFFVANKPNALIVDFFAGSGTTLHAVNLLNAEDGGHRRCVIVTNNEVSEAEEKTFRKQGLNPGDPEWEAKGIARYVTWPRTLCSIKGVNVQGEPLKGEYITVRGGLLGDRALPMSEGFKTNAAFFKLDFVDKDSVSLGKQFKELLPILWMKSGAKGKCPKVTQQTPPMLVLPENEFAVLTDESSFLEFEKQVKAAAGICDVYLVTDSNSAFKEMSLHFPGARCIQLYRDYLDNFRINKSMR